MFSTKRHGVAWQRLHVCALQHVAYIPMTLLYPMIFQMLLSVTAWQLSVQCLGVQPSRWLRDWGNCVNDKKGIPWTQVFQLPLKGSLCSAAGKPLRLYSPNFLSERSYLVVNSHMLPDFRTHRGITAYMLALQDCCCLAAQRGIDNVYCVR